MENERIETEEQLELELSRPHPETVEQLRSIPGDLLVLGAGGKMGPTLCRLLKNAVGDGKRRIYGVSRFSDSEMRDRLESAGVQTIRADLIERSTYAELPDAPNIFFLAGMKLGASAKEPLTWAMNTYVPALAAERWSGPAVRIAALSTGNVYPFMDVTSSPASVLNVAGPEILSVRTLAEGIARMAGTRARFTGKEQPTALLSDSSRCLELFGPPAVSLDSMLSRVVDWVRRGEKTLKKQTKYQVRDGKF